MKKDGFIKLAKSMVDLGIYVWDCNGELLVNINPAYIERKESGAKGTAKEKAQWLKDALKMYEKRKSKKGARAFDCSGYTCWCLRECGAMKAGFDTTANGLYNKYCDKVTKSKLTEGDLVFKYSSKEGKIVHVGIYLGGGKIAEAKGRAYGVIISDLTSSWNRYGRLKVFEEAFVLTRLLKKGCKGDDVKWVQRRLLELKYPLPKYKDDGDYGAETQKAIKMFQVDHNLTVDGIVGKNTIEALGGEWK